MIISEAVNSVCVDAGLYWEELQLKVLQSPGIRPVGLVIANGCSLKCDRAFSPRSLLEVGVVVSGHPGWPIALCVHKTSLCPQCQSVSKPSRSAAVVAVKMSLWFYCRVLVHVPCPESSQVLTLVHGMG